MADLCIANIPESLKKNEKGFFFLNEVEECFSEHQDQKNSDQSTAVTDKYHNNRQTSTVMEPVQTLVF